MGNISFSLKKVLNQAKSAEFLKAHLKECLSAQEYKHIISTRNYKNTLFLYLDSSSALYEFNLKKSGLLKCLEKKKIRFKSLVFKIGAQ
ncbi:MAG: hypothetical protein JW734_04080 [Candidatus Omnitrophica bacterium]|nr:hypothetical protein [Candidatus Omnitrophota bacterium]